MPSLKDLIDQAAADKEAEERGEVVLKPFVAPKHSAWLELPEADQAFTPEALKRGFEVMSNAHKVKRTERFSASGLGQCPRRQIFSFVGAPQDTFSLDSSDIMRLGTAEHFWIMLEGLSAGWLIDAEVFYFDKDWRVGGTLDGVLSDASIWEYKSVASSKFNKVTGTKGKSYSSDDPVEGGPAPEHLLQLEAYDLLTGMHLKTLFYQERNYGQFFEYRLGEQPEIREKLLKLLDRLNTHIDDNTLPEMLKPCISQTGLVYKDCPFRTHCPTAQRPYA